MTEAAADIPWIPHIPKDDTWTLLALIVSGTAASIWLERRYRWAEKLSGPVIALLIAMILSNTGIMPADAPAYDFVGGWLVPLALPLLLFRANIVRIARKTGKLLIAFNLAAVGTMIGAVAGFFLLKDHIPEPDKAAGVMTASYIGGMVNFVAVSASTKASGTMTSSLIVADNIIMAGLFLVLFWMVGSAFLRRIFRVQYGLDASTALAGEEMPEKPPKPVLDVLDLGVALGVAFCIAAAAMLLQRYLNLELTGGKEDWRDHVSKGKQMGIDLLTNKFVLITALSLIAATFFSRPLEKLQSAEPVGSFMLYLFLFCVGLPADVKSMFLGGEKGMVMLYLFLFCFIIAAANLIFVTLTARFFKLSLEDIVLASNASVGGPPTAAAMAMSKGWSRLVLPGLLAGLYGYSVGTPLGLMITHLLSNFMPK
ncbi:MAG TPA: DUF819 family protein [Verrucomicrobiales bacterium]|nr:DUF819 family protein [Verrucomicrobiales bacterium]